MCICVFLGEKNFLLLVLSSFVLVLTKNESRYFIPKVLKQSNGSNGGCT
jgi:hypothetical protein